jgi:hypothetical protein
MTRIALAALVLLNCTTELFAQASQDCDSCAHHTAILKYNNPHMSDQL